jgi:hypothetical protein
MQLLPCKNGTPIYIQHAAEFLDSRYFTRSNFRVAGEYSEGEDGGDKPPSAHHLPLKSVPEPLAGATQLCKALKSSGAGTSRPFSTSDTIVSADGCFRAIEVAGETAYETAIPALQTAKWCRPTSRDAGRPVDPSVPTSDVPLLRPERHIRQLEWALCMTWCLAPFYEAS